MLCQLIGGEKVDTSLWLRAEMLRLVEPMLNSLFLRLIMSPSLPTVVPFCRSTVSSIELCQLIEKEKQETNRLLRGEMDRLVNSLFLRLTNKLMVNMTCSGLGHVGERSLLVNLSDQVESPNTESHQPFIITQSSSIDPHFHQRRPIGVEEEYGKKILTEIKREIEEEEDEMTLKSMQDNTTQTNQFCTGLSLTDNHHLFYQMNSSLEDGQLSNGQVNNDTQQDWDGHEIQEGHDKQIMHIEEEEEEIVDGSDHEEEVEDDETEIDSDNGEGDEFNQNEESSRLFTSPPLDTTSPASQSPIRRQSARIVKRKVTEEEQPNEITNQDSKEDEEEDAEVAEEVTSRSVKRLRSSRHTISSSTEQKQIITQSSEKIATECTTNPIQPNRHLQCSHCLKSFVNKTDLQRHLRVHTGERPFHCDQCDKRFNVKGNLTQHQLIHQNIKRFQCHECDKQFTLKRNLDSHLLTHSGDRPFECRHCDKSFSDSSTRTKHEHAIHLHVKPYRCKQCGHTATQRPDITRHIRVIHFGLPQSIKEQRALNIIDGRDPKDLVEKV